MSIGISNLEEDRENFLGKFCHFSLSISCRFRDSFMEVTASESTPSLSREIVRRASWRVL